MDIRHVCKGSTGSGRRVIGCLQTGRTRTRRASMAGSDEGSAGSELDVLLGTEQTFPPQPSLPPRRTPPIRASTSARPPIPRPGGLRGRRSSSGSSPGTRSSTGRTRPSPNGLRAASSTSRPTASTATSRPAQASGSPTTGRARTASRREITYGWLARRGAALRQRPQVAGHRQGRRGRDLHADGPRGRGRDARLHADRRDPQRRLRRLQRQLGRRAHGGLRRQGPDHRRRDPAPRRADADEAGRRRGARRPARARARRRPRPLRHRRRR